MTAAEKRDIEYRRKVYELATQQIRDIDAVMEDRYRFPRLHDEAGAEGRDARFQAAKARYKPDADADLNPNREQEEWEKHQATKAAHRYGARDRGGSEQKEYEYVFEDQIAFVTDEILGGENVSSSSSSDEGSGSGSSDDDSGDEGSPDPVARERRRRARREEKRILRAKKKQSDEKAALAKERESKHLSEREAMAKDRASLPIYPYRADLIKAVEDHQVVVIAERRVPGKTTQIRFVATCGRPGSRRARGGANSTIC